MQIVRIQGKNVVLKAAGPVEDYDEELEDYDDPGDDLPPWDEEDEYTEDDE